MIPDMEKYWVAVSNSDYNKSWHRSEWHDYTSRCIYMITIMKMPGIPDFSWINGSYENGHAKANVQSSRLGHHIGRALKDLGLHFDFVKIYQYIFMPDHIHILIFITRKTEIHLETVIGHFMSDCNRRYKAILSQDYGYDFNGSIFQPGFNDRIMHGRNQLAVLYDYIKDNPRRLFIKRTHPEYFNTALLCSSSRQSFSVYGNIHLLEHPCKRIVRFSRKYTSEKWDEEKRILDDMIRDRGVLVSPFIHPEEKAFLSKALNQNGRCIIICDNGFHQRWKPSKGYMEACAEGRILFVGPAVYVANKINLTREDAMKMNALAEEIASLRAGSFSIRHLR